MDINVVNISKGPYELTRDVIEHVEISKLSFNVTSRLRYSQDSDYLGFQIDLLVIQDTTQVFKSGFLIGLLVQDWSKSLKEGLDLNQNHSKLIPICQTAWLVATGIVAIQSSSPNFNGIILPTINYEKFCREVILSPLT